MQIRYWGLISVDLVLASIILAHKYYFRSQVNGILLSFSYLAKAFHDFLLWFNYNCMKLEWILDINKIESRLLSSMVIHSIVITFVLRNIPRCLCIKSSEQTFENARSMVLEDYEQYMEENMDAELTNMLLDIAYSGNGLETIASTYGVEIQTLNNIESYEDATVFMSSENDYENIVSMGIGNEFQAIARDGIIYIVVLDDYTPTGLLAFEEALNETFKKVILVRGPTLIKLCPTHMIVTVNSSK